MLDSAIQAFLDDRKEAWLKKKIKSNSTDQDKLEFKQQANEEFSLATWLPSASKRAKQLFLVSHPGKFTHPSAKISSVIASAMQSPDGFLRTGNIQAELDVFGNAAAMDVYKFLSIELKDGKNVLSHLELATPEIEQQLTIPAVPFHEIAQDLLAIKQDDNLAVKTSGKIKQVYFPVDEKKYHLLSVLTPSNIMYKLKERINIMRFSDEAKEAREAKKKNHDHAMPLSEVYGLSVIGFGGTKPQNISVLNSQNHGQSYLLSSTPPVLKVRAVQPPRKSFFVNNLWLKAYADDFQKLHHLLIGDRNNIHIRDKRDWLIRSIIFQVTDRMWLVRHVDAGWSDSDHYQNLPHAQKVWLDQQYAEQRDENLEWMESIKTDLTRWFINSYRKLIGDQALDLGDEQMPHIKSVIEGCEEALR